MAGSAKRLTGLGEERGLPGAVGKVAVETPLGDRCVLHPAGEGGVGVALDAEVPERLLQDLLVIGAVRGMAGGALLHARVGVGRLQAEIGVRVTLDAQIGLRILEAQGAHETVGLVAGLAIPFRHRLVSHADVLAHLLVAFNAGLALLEAPPSLELGGGGPDQQRRDGERGDGRRPAA
jgi:hypothetical protein